MKVNKEAAVIMIAGIALYELLGPDIERLRVLVDSFVIAELAYRAFMLDEFVK